MIIFALIVTIVWAIWMLTGLISFLIGFIGELKSEGSLSVGDTLMMLSVCTFMGPIGLLWSIEELTSFKLPRPKWFNKRIYK